MVEKGNVVSLEDRIPKLKQRRKKKANRRAIMLLAFFFILLVLVLYFLSPLSDIKQIKVSGNKYLSDEIIIKTSNIKLDTNIWKLDKDQISEELKTLSEIDAVSISREFPNTVVISVDEYNRLGYLVKGKDYHPIVSNGKILGALEGSEIPVNAPVLQGFEEGKALQAVIDALEELPDEINNVISEIHYTPTDTDEYHIVLFMNDGFEVSANSKTLAEKLVYYPSIVSQLEEGVKGVIDLEVGSFFREYESAPSLDGSEGLDENEGGQQEEDESEG
ncbi:MAG: cell division protein FtsQ/DivIB [Bacillus sp. (in: firmicutes)]